MRQITSSRAPIVAAWLAALATFALHPQAKAATDDWVGRFLSGLPLRRDYNQPFEDSSSWSTGAVPGPADTAEFNAAAAYDVTFFNNFTNAALTVSDGTVTFSSPSGLPTYTVGNVSITASLTVSGAGFTVTQSPLLTTVVGATSNSVGSLQVNAGATYSAGTLQINPTGTASIAGATLDVSGLTASGGSLQADNASTVNFAESAMVTVQNGGHADLGGPVSMQAAIVGVTGAGSHFNVAQPVAMGHGVSGQDGILTFQNSATGSFPGGVSLTESSNTTSSLSVQGGAQVTAGNLGVGADGTSTNSTPQLFISGAGSSLTQIGAATLNVGTFSATGTSFGLMKVLSGGSFTSGTGPTVVSVNSTVQVLGGTYNANADITFSGSTFQQDSAGHFNLAPGKTITFINDAMVTISGAFTGGNVDNEVSMQVTGGHMAVQSFDGAGDVTVAAGAQLTADHLRQASLTLSGNAAMRAQAIPDSNPSASSLGRLTILGTGQLDLSNNRLAINYAAGNSPANTIRSYLVTGFHNGAWNGPGISSSAADGSHALGFADSADGVVAGLAANTVLVKFTRLGDLNLDGVVNFTDLLILAQHYGQPTSKWDQGDLNYDGTVNFADLLGLAQNYGGTLSAAQLDTFPPSFRSDVVGAFAEVPEPAMLGVVFVGAILLARRPRDTDLVARATRMVSPLAISPVQRSRLQSAARHPPGEDDPPAG